VRERREREREKRNFYSRGSCVLWVKLSFDQREGED
jgi:hypothetical protein